ncbi:WcaI family glycosyltransferase [Neorhizobium galegae]|uniref:WcaI family glycosyltransferase n=1 Tax=Neorhizobium galegae TaxID=399 RepID=UPI002106BA3B|nr:WcaI family glycosyltransferase [Neorhizobium galegae]MCQ1850335.1 WcaI family glycosyltransferase [Neorhizobium galegae]
MTAAVQPLSDECERSFDAALGLATAVATSPRKCVVVYAMNYAPETAGVGKYTGEIAEYLAAEGMDVTVVTTPPHYPGWSVQAGYRNRYSSGIEGRIKVLRSPLLLRRKMRGIWRLLAPLSFAITSAPLVFWQILRHRPITVFCVEPTLFAAPAAQLAAKLVGARTVLHVHDMEVDAAFAVGHLSSKTWLKRLGHAFERSVLGRFDQLVTISNRMAEGLALKHVPATKVSVVRNWVDLAQFHPMEDVSPYRAELGFGHEDFVVLYSGSIGAKQGLNVLLDAAERLKDERRIHFVISGEGPQKPELETRYGHLENLRFLAFQPYSRLNAFLNMPDLHVLPQDRSAADLTLPSKLGGMLASGKPVLVTADEGTELAQFVEDSVYLTPPNDPEKLAACIVRAMSEREEWRPQVQTVLVQYLSKRPAILAIKQLIDGGNP